MKQGTRFPTLAFVTGGAGEASDGIPPQPFETFCYDAALLQAKIHNFNVVPYTSVLPKELHGNIVAVDKVAAKFHHGAVLEVIMAAAGTKLSDHRSIATGLGICWGKDKKGRLIGGWAAEYVERFQTHIDDEIAKMHARMWLTKSLNHELSLRGVAKHSEFQYWRLAGSYVNFLITNGRVILPMLAANTDADALRIIQAIFPNHAVVGVPAREILLGGGDIHCITQQIPRLRPVSTEGVAGTAVMGKIPASSENSPR